jgi:osmotically-inducible protein OsmY
LCRLRGQRFRLSRGGDLPGKKGSGPMATTSVTDIQTRAQTALAESPFYELRELKVERENQILTIAGVVSSYYHKQLAQEVVRSMCQGIEVVNSIRVR